MESMVRPSVRSVEFPGGLLEPRDVWGASYSYCSLKSFLKSRLFWGSDEDKPPKD